MAASQQRKPVFLILAIVVGVVLGWTARGILDDAVNVAQTQEESVASTKSELANEAQDASGFDKPVARPSSRSSLTSETSQAAESVLVRDDQRDSQTIPQAPRSRVERRAVPVSDAHASFIRSQYRNDEETGERRAVRDILESEATDDSWSYFMEQTLHMFISSHANAGNFSIFHIECRTTLCEIQAIGFDESTQPDWSSCRSSQVRLFPTARFIAYPQDNSV